MLSMLLCHASHVPLCHAFYLALPCQAVSLASVLLITIVLVRAAFTYPVAAAASHLMRRSPTPGHRRTISFLDATVLMWGGLARGAITLALAYHHFSPPHKAMPSPDQQVGAHFMDSYMFQHVQ